MRRGFSLLEVVLALGLLAAFLVVGVQVETALQNTIASRGVRQLNHVLSIAHLRAQHGVNGTAWGVYFAYDESTRVGTQATVFSGTSYATRDTSQDLLFALGRDVRFTNIQLGGATPSGGNDHEIVFSPFSGSTNQYGSITVASFNSTLTWNISSSGTFVRP